MSSGCPKDGEGPAFCAGGVSFKKSVSNKESRSEEAPAVLRPVNNSCASFASAGALATLSPLSGTSKLLIKSSTSLRPLDMSSCVLSGCGVGVLVSSIKDVRSSNMGSLAGSGSTTSSLGSSDISSPANRLSKDGASDKSGLLGSSSAELSCSDSVSSLFPELASRSANKSSSPGVEGSVSSSPERKSESALSKSMTPPPLDVRALSSSTMSTSSMMSSEMSAEGFCAMVASQNKSNTR